MTKSWRKPQNPKLVLLLSIVAPGAGHVVSGLPFRGLGFAFFTLLFCFLSWKLSSPDRSFIGRSAGGLFVWALSIPDAYRYASLRRRRWDLSA
jgi:hypothetical protein